MLGPLSRHIAAAVAVLLLSACTPEYNWREVAVAEGRASATFPARVSAEQRPVRLGDDELPFTLSAATVGKAIYAVGHLVLPEAERADPRAAQRWAELLARSLYANHRVEPPAALPAPGEDILIDSEIGGVPFLTVARVAVIDGALIEIVAAGPRDALPLARAREFVSSLKPAR